MHIRVPIDRLEIGMYVDEIEGSWLDHPFWRSSFRISTPRQLAKLRASGIASVIIDDSRGLGLGEDAAAAAPIAETSDVAAPERTSTHASGSRGSRRPAQSDQPCSADAEVERATAIVERSKHAVKAMFDDVRLGKAINSGEFAPLVDEISNSIARNPYALIGIARLKNKDEYTYLHSVAVCALMINLARHLALDEALMRDIGMAGLLHDVGKMAVPAALLHKPGALTDAEFTVVKDHPERGHEVLCVSGAVPEIARDVCLHHHERVDGAGYPYGLKGDAISLYARMGAICDVYDAVTSERCYKSAWHPAEALARMAQWVGHFDPHLFAVFERSVGIYPVGTLVRLRSNRLALVVEECSDDLTRPILTLFYSVIEERLVPPQTLRLNGIDDRIVARENPGTWALGDWPALKARLLDRPTQRDAA